MQRLYWALAFALCSAFGVGFNLGSTNLVEPYIRCWINEVTLHNLTETECNNAANTSMPAIQEQLHLVTGYWALAISATAIGAMVGGFFAGSITDHFGFKITMVGNSVLGIIFNLVLASCRKIGSYPVFTVFRFLIGLNLGVDSMVAPVFIDHISPKKRKDAFGVSYQVTVTIGMLVAEVISIHWILGTNSRWPYRMLKKNLEYFYPFLKMVFFSVFFKFLCLGFYPRLLNLYFHF